VSELVAVPAVRLDFTGALAHLMGRVGEHVIVVVGGAERQDRAGLAKLEGTLVVVGEHTASCADEVTSPVTFSFDENPHATVTLDPVAFRGAWESVTVLTLQIGSTQVEVIKAPEERVEHANDPEPTPRFVRPPAEPPAEHKRPTAGSPADSAAGGTADPSRWQRFRDSVWSNVVAAGVIAAATAVIVAIVNDDPTPAPDRPAKIDQVGDIDRGTFPRVLKQRGVRNAYVVDDGVPHHIATPETYNDIVGYYPVQFDVEETEWGKWVKSEDGADAVRPQGQQPVLSPRKITDRYILRMRSGKAWQLVAGKRVPIRDGATFNCLADRLLVWDFVSPGEIASFPLHPSLGRARC
jgi:hypothetical protein